MAAGDRNKKGKATDIVRHYNAAQPIIFPVKGLCGRKNVGYATDDKNDVTCLSCLKKLNQSIQ